jgi:uncharacterized protein
MKSLWLSLLAIVAAAGLHAQTLNTEPYKIVFQMVSEDTTAHKALMKQLNNILSTEPDTQIEVICHGPALNMLVAKESVVAEKIHQYLAKGIHFHACEFSMSERKVSAEEILPDVSFVKAGILAIVARQKEGWYYIKAGF